MGFGTFVHLEGGGRETHLEQKWGGGVRLSPSKLGVMFPTG